MLESVKIAKRQSELRQQLATLAGKEKPTDDEVRAMGDLDREYSTNEVRYRAALVAEDTERREAGADLETRSDRQFADLVAAFEMRQVALHLDEGRALSGRTAEVVQELRNAGGYRGVPVPLMALEQRAGETVSTGTPSPVAHRPIIDRIFPDSVAAKMGCQMIQIGSGSAAWPVTTSAITAGWAATEGGNVAGPTAYTTTDKALSPDNTLGVHMRITRKSLLQSGDALEAAIRRDMNGAMAAELDRAIFLGAGSGGEPLGIVAGAATYGITATDLSAEPTYANFLTEIVAFMTANVITNPGEIRALMRPELFGYLEGKLNTVTQTTEYYRLALLLTGRSPTGFSPSNLHMTSNAIAAPTGTPAETSMVLTTSTGGIAPAFVGLWGAVDLIRDPYADAQSGGLRLTALTTADVTVARPAQTRILSGIQLAAA